MARKPVDVDFSKRAEIKKLFASCLKQEASIMSRQERLRERLTENEYSLLRHSVMANASVKYGDALASRAVRHLDAALSMHGKSWTSIHDLLEERAKRSRSERIAFEMFEEYVVLVDMALMSEGIEVRIERTQPLCRKGS